METGYIRPMLPSNLSKHSSLRLCIFNSRKELSDTSPPNLYFTDRRTPHLCHPILRKTRTSYLTNYCTQVVDPDRRYPRPLYSHRILHRILVFQLNIHRTGLRDLKVLSCPTSEDPKLIGVKRIQPTSALKSVLMSLDSESCILFHPALTIFFRIICTPIATLKVTHDTGARLHTFRFEKPDAGNNHPSL